MALIEGPSRANPRTTHENAGIASLSSVKVIWDAEVGSYEEEKRLYSRVRWAIHRGRLGLSRVREVMRGSFDNPDLRIASNVYLRASEIGLPRPGGVEIYRYIAVVLYDTEVIRYYPDGTFSVDNGGFNTPTTSSRVTQFTPAGWIAWHKDKQLIMHGYIDRESHVYGDYVDVHPATHDVRIDPKKGRVS